MTLKPGESSTLRVTFTMHEGMGGPHLFEIRVKSNDPVEPEKLLIVKSNWIP